MLLVQLLPKIIDLILRMFYVQVHYKVILFIYLFVAKEGVCAVYCICACMCVFKYVRGLGTKLRPIVLFPQLGWARQGG